MWYDRKNISFSKVLTRGKTFQQTQWHWEPLNSRPWPYLHCRAQKLHICKAYLYILIVRLSIATWPLALFALQIAKIAKCNHRSELCKNILDKFRGSLSKFFTAHTKKCTMQLCCNISASHYQNMAVMFLHYSVYTYFIVRHYCTQHWCIATWPFSLLLYDLYDDYQTGRTLRDHYTAFILFYSTHPRHGLFEPPVQ